MIFDDLVKLKVLSVNERREEILTAFIAKYGYEPDEMIIHEQPSENKFWVEKRKNWISVKDRLPEKDGRYLVVENHFGGWVGVSSIREGNFDTDVKYWMPLPEAPK